MVGKALDWAMALLFVLSAAVQYNDPDPLRWMALYGVTAAVAAASALGRARVFHSAVIGLTALAWALSIAPRVVGTDGFPDFGLGVGMKTEVIEETRELVGLLISAAWCFVVAVRAHRRRA